MKYLLDTNICIYLIKRKLAQVLAKYTKYAPEDVGVSSITAAELLFGVEKSLHVEQNRKALEQFLLPLTIWSFNTEAALAYGKVRRSLESKGQPIGPLDTLIAAHALALQVVLVTNNVREFQRVDGLILENWVV